MTVILAAVARVLRAPRRARVAPQQALESDVFVWCVARAYSTTYYIAAA